MEILSLIKKSKQIKYVLCSDKRVSDLSIEKSTNIHSRHIGKEINEISIWEQNNLHDWKLSPHLIKSSENHQKSPVPKTLPKT